MTRTREMLKDEFKNYPKFLFLFSSMIGTEAHSYTTRMMLDDNPDLLDELKDKLWDQLDLQNANDENEVVSRIVNFTRSGEGPVDDYEVSLTYTVDATSHEVAVEKVVELIRNAYENNRDVTTQETDTVIFNCVNTRTDDVKMITTDI